VTTFDAVVLAGGAGSRLGGVSKADVELAGLAMLDHVLVGLSAASVVVVVGPPSIERPGVRRVQEQPPGGGPVAGLAAGLRGLTESRAPAPLVVVLACDVPRGPAAIPALLASFPPAPVPAPAPAPASADPSTDTDTSARDRHLQVSISPAGVGLGVDGARLLADGRPQHLVAVYRRAALDAAFERLGDPAGASMRALVAGLHLVDVPDPADLAADADTWPDVHRLDAELRGTIGP
jgi:molybdopterin-guanine dinucleotide biosynthesis protein A